MLTPDMLARLDQESAACNERLDELVTYARGVIGTVGDPNVAAQLIAVAINNAADPARRSTALGYALVRLAKQSPGGEPS